MNTTKLLVKLFLVISLFCAGVFADDGHMTNGDKTCTGNCLIENQPEVNPTKDISTDNPILKYVREYLFSIFG